MLKKQAIIHDYFISYKISDASEFVAELVASLQSRGATCWYDQEAIGPGDSILKSIEDGMKSCIDGILVMSEQYFKGWSEQERRSLYNRFVGGRMRLIPIVFGMTWSEFSNRAPMFADMKAIVVQSPSAARASEVAKDIVAGARFDQRRSRLFEMYFSKLETLYPEDPDIRMWTALFAGDDKVEQLKKALDDGADPNLTDSALWNRYAKKSILEHSDSIFEEWRKLYLFLFDPNNK